MQKTYFRKSLEAHNKQSSLETVSELLCVCGVEDGTKPITDNNK